MAYFSIQTQNVKLHYIRVIYLTPMTPRNQKLWHRYVEPVQKCEVGAITFNSSNFDLNKTILQKVMNNLVILLTSVKSRSQNLCYRYMGPTSIFCINV